MTQTKERRRAVDLEEAKLQAEKRRQAIQRARQLQYQQTDRIKSLQVICMQNTADSQDYSHY